MRKNYDDEETGSLLRKRLSNQIVASNSEELHKALDDKEISNQHKKENYKKVKKYQNDVIIDDINNTIEEKADKKDDININNIINEATNIIEKTSMTDIKDSLIIDEHIESNVDNSLVDVKEDNLKHFSNNVEGNLSNLKKTYDAKDIQETIDSFMDINEEDDDIDSINKVVDDALNIFSDNEDNLISAKKQKEDSNISENIPQNSNQIRQDNINYANNLSTSNLANSQNTNEVGNNYLLSQSNTQYGNNYVPNNYNNGVINNGYNQHIPMQQTQKQIKRNKKNRMGNKLLGLILNFLVYMCILVICYFVITKFFIGFITLSGDSMNPTYYNEETLIVDKISFNFKNNIDRYKVIVFEKDNIQYVKRVIGIPGDKIYISENGEIYINGKVYKEEYKFDKITDAGLASNEIELGINEYFVLGDNRSISLDSRSFGVVTKNEIKGIVLFSLNTNNKLEENSESQ